MNKEKLTAVVTTVEKNRVRLWLGGAAAVVSLERGS